MWQTGPEEAGVCAGLSSQGRWLVRNRLQDREKKNVAGGDKKPAASSDSKGKPKSESGSTKTPKKSGGSS